jgi:hypothetical protein
MGEAAGLSDFGAFSFCEDRRRLSPDGYTRPETSVGTEDATVIPHGQRRMRRDICGGDMNRRNGRAFCINVAALCPTLVVRARRRGRRTSSVVSRGRRFT